MVKIVLHNNYGAVFSPDGTKLYLTSGFSDYPTVAGRLLQYDISSFDSATIANSKYEYNYPLRDSSGGFFDLSTWPDGKIYVARVYTRFLSSINNPNEKGAASSFVDRAVNLGSGVGFTKKRAFRYGWKHLKVTKSLRSICIGEVGDGMRDQTT